MIDLQLFISVFQTVEYCSFHKSENKKEITSCSFGPKLSKSFSDEFQKNEIIDTHREDKNSKCRIIC